MHASRLVLLAAILVAALSLACGASNDAASGRDADSGGSFSSAAAESGVSQGTEASQAAQSLKVIVTTTLGLTVENLAEAYDRTARLTREHGGYVAVADVASGGQNRSAAVELRVPAARAGDLVDALKTQPGVSITSEAVTSREVTAEYTDLQSRLLNLQRTEAQYQELLNRAASIDEILTVSTRLNATRDDVEQIQGRIRLLDDQVDYATVRLNLTLAVPVSATAAGHADPIRVMTDAWQEAVAVAWLVLSVMAVLAVATVWLAPAVLFVLIGLRVYRRLAPLLQRMRL